MRKKPYTEIGLNRIKCFRYSKCHNQATSQFNICADKNVYRGLCNKCDIELNESVLKFMGFEDWKSKMREYRETFVTIDQRRIANSITESLSDKLKKKLNTILRYRTV